MSDRLTPELPAGWADLEREDQAALAPPDGAKERVQRRVALTLGLGAGFVAATIGTSTAAAASVAAAGAAGGTGAAATGLIGTLLAKKALVLGVAAAVGVGGGTAAYIEVRSERAKSRATTTAPAPSRAPVPIARPLPPPALEPPAPQAEPEAAPDTLGEEGSLLDLARKDIARGQLREAAVLLDRHTAQFPTGHLVEEREALIIRLLVREGRESEARARAARFRRAHPRSIQLPGIDAALRERR